MLLLLCRLFYGVQHIKEAVEGQSKQAEATHAHMTKTAGTIWKVNANEFPG
jgi:hypothetical protein